MIKLFLQNYKNIFEGIFTVIKFQFLKKEDKEEIRRRRKICAECIFMSENYKKLGYKSNRPDKHCSLCQCNIFLKTACLGCNCGIEKYNKENNTNTELKWKAIKQKN